MSTDSTSTSGESVQSACEDADDKDVRTQSFDVDVKRYFCLKNAASDNLVLDVQGMSRAPGTPVILWDRKFSTNHRPDMLLNQLWYEDTDTSTIRSALNNFCLDLYGQLLSHMYYRQHSKFALAFCILHS